MSINHKGDLPGYTNFYVSDSDGVKFGLSLQYLVSDEDQNVDFE